MIGPDEVNEPQILSQFYHSHAFQYLIREHRAEIRKRLVETPTALRSAELAVHFPVGQKAGGEDAWQRLNGYLAKVEAAIAAIVRGHSPAFWFHLHRRLAPRLSVVHSGKRDDTTVALVRQIAELAYCKYGDLERSDDLGPISKTRVETLLGGAFYAATTEAYGSKLKARSRFEDFKRSSQVVMTKFRADDLVSVFEIEGLCYEYWRASAAMRSVGKGSFVEWSAAADWFKYHQGGPPPLAFELYDERIEDPQGMVTRLGTWADMIPDDDRKNFYFAQVNPNPEKGEYLTWNPETDEIGKGVGIVNFQIGFGSLATFYAANQFIAEAFAKKHGITLSAVLTAVWALTFLGFFKADMSWFRDQKIAKRRVAQNLGNLYFRGYAVFAMTIPELWDEAVWWAEQLEELGDDSKEDVLRALRFITLDAAAQSKVGLWSGGKRPIAIPAPVGSMIDLAGVSSLLSSLFFGVRESTGAKGPAFEEAVRQALERLDVEVVHVGELRWADGHLREVDAAVRKGTRLILLECFSVERPLDYELSKPAVFEERVRRISEKLEQAKSLAAVIKERPKGSNFDFGWAAEVDWRLVSPFIEFTPELVEPHIDASGVVRVMQVREALDWLVDDEVPGARVSKAVAATADL